MLLQNRIGWWYTNDQATPALGGLHNQSDLELPTVRKAWLSSYFTSLMNQPYSKMFGVLENGMSSFYMYMCSPSCLEADYLGADMSLSPKWNHYVSLQEYWLSQARTNFDHLEVLDLVDKKPWRGSGSMFHTCGVSGCVDRRLKLAPIILFPSPLGRIQKRVNYPGILWVLAESMCYSTVRGRT